MLECLQISNRDRKTSDIMNQTNNPMSAVMLIIAAIIVVAGLVTYGGISVSHHIQHEHTYKMAQQHKRYIRKLDYETKGNDASPSFYWSKCNVINHHYRHNPTYNLGMSDAHDGTLNVSNLESYRLYKIGFTIGIQVGYASDAFEAKSIDAPMNNWAQTVQAVKDGTHFAKVHHKNVVYYVDDDRSGSNFGKKFWSTKNEDLQ